jgi:hypothetical protein
MEKLYNMRKHCPHVRGTEIKPQIRLSKLKNLTIPSIHENRE